MFVVEIDVLAIAESGFCFPKVSSQFEQRRFASRDLVVVTIAMDQDRLEVVSTLRDDIVLSSTWAPERNFGRGETTSVIYCRTKLESVDHCVEDGAYYFLIHRLILLYPVSSFQNRVAKEIHSPWANKKVTAKGKKIPRPFWLISWWHLDQQSLSDSCTFHVSASKDNRNNAMKQGF